MKRLPETLHAHIPPNAFEYIQALQDRYPFDLHISKPRKTKKGLYRFDRLKGTHLISVNRDLNPYDFLLTLLHEIAHRIVRKEYGDNADPHGKEWKTSFGLLIQDSLHLKLFADVLENDLRKFMKNPPASMSGNHKVYETLMLFDKSDDLVMLKQLKTDEEFEFQGKIYKMKFKHRTRYQVLNLKDKREYLISGIARVKPLSR